MLAPIRPRVPAPAVRSPGGEVDAPAEVRVQIQRLRAEVRAALAALAARVDAALLPALAAAMRAWDGAGDDRILDESSRDRALIVRTSLARTAAEARVPAVRAVALEGLLALDAALGLIDVVERRLPSLIRLRVRARGGLLPGGRPFLDVGRALAEAARGWS